MYLHNLLELLWQHYLDFWGDTHIKTVSFHLLSDKQYIYQFTTVCIITIMLFWASLIMFMIIGKCNYGFGIYFCN